MLRFDTSLKALEATQVAIQTTAGNISNVDTPGYTRQEAILKSGADTINTVFGPVGQGVDDVDIVRKADSFLEERIRSNNQGMGRLREEEKFMRDIASVMDPVQGGPISQMNEFLDDLQELASRPEDKGLREAFAMSAESLTFSFRDRAQQFEEIMDEIQSSIKEQVDQVNDIIQRVAQLNAKISVSKSDPHELLDQRGQLLKELGNAIETSVHYNDKNNAQVVSANRLLVDGAQENFLETVEQNGMIAVRYQGSNTPLNIQNGALGGLLDMQNSTLPGYWQNLDTMAAGFAREVNNVHSAGIGASMESLKSEQAVADPSASLVSQGFTIQNGVFTVRMRDQATGLTADTSIAVDPSADSLQDVASALNSVANLSAAVDANGYLTLQAQGGYNMAFPSDSSYFLAELGVNALFSGRTAKEMQVSDFVQADVSHIALSANYSPGNNENALAMLDTVHEQSHTVLGDVTFHQYLTNESVRAGKEASTRKQQANLQSQVLDSLETRRQSVSGVSRDEELINLTKFQHGYQAAARLFQSIDQLMETAINLGN